MVRILPFCEQMALYEQLDWKGLLVGPVHDSPITKSIDGSVTAPARQMQVPYTICPDDVPKNDINWAQTSYTGCIGAQRATSADDALCGDWNIPDVTYDAARGDANHSGTDDPSRVSGPFGRYLYRTGNFGTVRDGTANTFFAGEQIGECTPYSGGWWLNDQNLVMGRTSVPLNTMTTCAKTEAEATRKRYYAPKCYNTNQHGFSWGFRSNHPAGANFLMGDASVQFINSSIRYPIYFAYGGKNDGLPTTDDTRE